VQGIQAEWVQATLKEWKGLGLAVVVVNPLGSCKSGWREDQRGISHASAACQYARNKA